MASIEELKYLQIPLQDISLATNGFSKGNHIGWGGFGHVYQGISEKHGKIAVKRLELGHAHLGIGQGDREFKTEIALLSVYKHENIVSLHGFCDEGREKILVYKLESKGSLDNHLYSKDLTWIQRLQICVDAACGLKYLHHDVGLEHRIIHRDVKSSNILLDETWKAKISDFGLSKIGPANVERTFLISTACGTIGYIDPEYLHTGVLTKESDVYSFGVVLFEVLCGRPARIKHESQFLFSLAQKHYENETLDKIIHSDLQNQINKASLSTFSTIAYHCLKKRRKERPTMKKVVEQLKKALELASNGSGPDKYYGLSDDDTTNNIFYDDFDALHLGESGSMESSSESIPASSSTSRKWTYDVFISFRGEDTRKTFVDHLYSALEQQGIYSFKDDEKLRRGNSISTSLLKAIEDSCISLIIFSENYASSSWCLDELVYIMKCKNEKGAIVMPIYYNVDPTDVRKQNGKFGEAFAKLEFQNNNNVVSWRKALVDAGNIFGWERNDTANGHESKLIKKIVDDISYKLLSIMSSAETTSETTLDANLVGIETRMHDLVSVLDFGSRGVQMVGICGIWGSGKSTLASSIYKQNRYRFDGSCFVKNVRAVSRMYGLKTLQEKILSNVLKSNVSLTNTKQGTSMMKRRLCQKRVLVVLDDVDHIDHLKLLAGSNDWFGEGSRIIITTRNEDLMIAHNVITHKVRMLDFNEALKLFTIRVLLGRPAKDYAEVSRKLVSKCGGHPSALISLGSFLRGKDMSEWLNTLARLEGISIDEILEKFNASDDGVTRDIFFEFLT